MLITLDHYFQIHCMLFQCVVLSWFICFFILEMLPWVTLLVFILFPCFVFILWSLLLPMCWILFACLQYLSFSLKSLLISSCHFYLNNVPPFHPPFLKISLVLIFSCVASSLVIFILFYFLLAKQEILLGKGTWEESRRVREPRRTAMPGGIGFQVVFSQSFWLKSPSWWCMSCSAKMDASEKDSGRWLDMWCLLLTFPEFFRLVVAY